MSRDDYGDPGAATWGNPGAVTVGYIPEEEPKKVETRPECFYQYDGLVPTGIPFADKILENMLRASQGTMPKGNISEEEPPKFGFKTTPEKDHGWRDLKIVQGQIIEGRDTGDEAE